MLVLLVNCRTGEPAALRNKDNSCQYIMPRLSFLRPLTDSCWLMLLLSDYGSTAIFSRQTSQKQIDKRLVLRDRQQHQCCSCEDLRRCSCLFHKAVCAHELGFVTLVKGAEPWYKKTDAGQNKAPDLSLAEILASHNQDLYHL